MEIAECLADGTGILPRRLLGADAETEALLSAFIGQPIIFAGHHHDAQDGMSNLIAFARFVNSFGAVMWQRLNDIVRSNYQTRIEGTKAVVRVAARRVTVRLPAIEELVVERPWLVNGTEEPLLVRAAGGSEPHFSELAGRRATVRTPGGHGAVEILSPYPGMRQIENVPRPRFSLWPFVRRTITEGRDRLYPFVKL